MSSVFDWSGLRIRHDVNPDDYEAQIEILQEALWLAIRAVYTSNEVMKEQMLRVKKGDLTSWKDAIDGLVEFIEENA